MYAPMYNIIGVYWRINMLINLTELFTREGKTNDYAVELDCREFQIPQGICPVSDSKPVTFHIENVGPDIGFKRRSRIYSDDSM